MLIASETCCVNLVFLITIVVEDFSDQRTPHQLRVSMFDLKERRDNSRKKVLIYNIIWLFVKTVVI